MRFSRHFSSEIFGCVSVQSIFGRLLDAVLHFLPAFSLVKHCCLDFIFTRVLRPYLLNTQHSVGFIGRARESIRCCVLGGWVGWRLVTFTYNRGGWIDAVWVLGSTEGFSLAVWNTTTWKLAVFCFGVYNSSFW